MKENKNRMIDRQIKVTIPLLNLVSLANHDMRKTWCYVCGVYGGMFRKTQGVQISVKGMERIV